MTPAWLAAAREDVGLREVRGAPTAPKIAGWLKTLKAWWSDDETPWCGTACAAWMLAAGVQPPAAWYRAKAWATWGQPLGRAVEGCVVVFDRVVDYRWPPGRDLPAYLQLAQGDAALSTSEA